MDLLMSFNPLSATYIYTLSLHDALPICGAVVLLLKVQAGQPTVTADVFLKMGTYSVSFAGFTSDGSAWSGIDRKSTRLNSSHANISYAVFCLKKKKAAVG